MATITPYMTLKEIQHGLQQGDFTSVELVDFYLDRIHRYDKELHSFVTVFEEDARLTAAQADKLRQQDAVKSPLHGIPNAIKDLLAVEGTRCTASSLIYADNVSTSNADTVNDLLAAHSPILGKVHLVEFAFGGYGTNVHLGAPKNPWDKATHRCPGGSSSGSAVAVAAGLVPFTLGTDTGGSVRIPAALNGLVGLKPTQDRISRKGCIPLSDSLDSIGPLTLNVDDALTVYECLSNDKITLGDMKQLKIAYLDPYSLGIDVDPEVIGMMEKTKAALIAAGANIETIKLDFSWYEQANIAGVIITAEAYAFHQQDIEATPEKYNPITLTKLSAGKDISAEQYQQALKKREEDIAMFNQLMSTWDILLLPTLIKTAIPLAEVDELANIYGAITRAVNYFNGCGMSIPVGLDSKGLPIGAQIVSNAHQESKLATLAKTIEQVMPFHHHPKGFD